MSWPTWPIAFALASSGCGFQPSLETDAGPRDAADAMRSDGPGDGGMAASCNAIHLANPALPSGTYTVDPDGDGPDTAVSVGCDMVTGGGGWTIVYTAPTPNLTTAATSYQVASTRLLQDAQLALIAFRDQTLASSGSYASFPLPADWRTSTPMSASATDVTVMVSVDDAAPSNELLRYGQSSFAPNCGDPWQTTTKYGRICIVGTAAPFYNGFADPASDMCTSSTSQWYSRQCTSNLQFSIAVR